MVANTPLLAPLRAGADMRCGVYYCLASVRMLAEGRDMSVHMAVSINWGSFLSVSL